MQHDEIKSLIIEMYSYRLASEVDLDLVDLLLLLGEEEPGQFAVRCQKVLRRNQKKLQRLKWGPTRQTVTHHGTQRLRLCLMRVPVHHQIF